MKVYAVYSMPKSPEYKLEALFKTKESAKKFIAQIHTCNNEFTGKCVYDIQIEEVKE